MATEIKQRMTVPAALAGVREADDRVYAIMLEHGTLELGFYKPDGIDPQQPHDRDEVYIVHSGTGIFICDGEHQDFEAGEALFVPAGVVHRFHSFSDDFSAWVIFYGARGGEAPGHD